MTKRELIDALERFDDAQRVFVYLHTDTYPNGCQIQIQGVADVPPWHPVSAGYNLIGLVCHDRNAEIKGK